MAWTAKLASKPERRDSMNYVAVTFVSDQPGVAPITVNHFGDDLDADGLKLFVAHKIRSLEAGDMAWDSLKSMKTNDPIEPAAIVVDPNVMEPKSK